MVAHNLIVLWLLSNLPVGTPGKVNKVPLLQSVLGIAEVKLEHGCPRRNVRQRNVDSLFKTAWGEEGAAWARSCNMSRRDPALTQETAEHNLPTTDGRIQRPGRVRGAKHQDLFVVVFPDALHLRVSSGGWDA